MAFSNAFTVVVCTCSGYCAYPEHVPDPNDQCHSSRHIIAWSDLTALPWRNGGGVTRQILSRRLDETGNWLPSSDDDWDWRLSIADVDRPGPFSRFDGMTRILTIIDGESITLTVDGAIEELERHRPFRFDGGADTSAKLPHGPIRDLNLITRTGTVDAEVSIEALSADRPRPVVEGQYCVLLEGQALLGTAVADADLTGVLNVELERYDTVLGDAKNPPTIAGDGVLAVITVSAITGASSALSQPDRTGIR